MASVPYLNEFIRKNPRIPYVIAEIGVNHEGSLELAKKLIDLSKEGGAHAAKFQTYKAEKIAARQSPSYWDLTKEKTTSQFELFKKYDAFSEKEYAILADHCRKVGIDFLSTPFDLEAVDWLNPHVPFFKIASADITNIPLLRKVASTGKSIVLSTGASRPGEVDEAVAVLKKAGCPEIILLHCVLNYPCPDVNAHLDMIESMRKTYPDLSIGYSDHTVPDENLTAMTLATLKGAVVLEKHFTHDKTLPGNDHYHAMDAGDLRRFWRYLGKVNDLRGQGVKMSTKDEVLSRKNARRSIVTQGGVRKGERLTEKNLICKRPASGISPLHWEKALGASFKADFPDDHILQWSDLENVPADKVVAVVQARMGSSRFPGKMLQNLGGHSMIEWVLKRTLQAKRVQKVVLATTTQPEDDALAAKAKAMGVEVYRGDVDDVASRFWNAIQQGPNDAIVRVCADNPFVDPDEIDRLVEFYQATFPDYAYNHRPVDTSQRDGYADGFGAEIFPRRLLQEVVRHASPAQKEHVTKYIWDNRENFIFAGLAAPKEIQGADLRFDVDTPEDLRRLEPMAQKLGLQGKAADFVRMMRS